MASRTITTTTTTTKKKNPFVDEDDLKRRGILKKWKQVKAEGQRQGRELRDMYRWDYRLRKLQKIKHEDLMKQMDEEAKKEREKELMKQMMKYQKGQNDDTDETYETDETDDDNEAEESIAIELSKKTIKFLKF